ncbi:MAG: hypothetical protein ACLPKI_30775 [Streptosporangiaceae bacterium]
MRTYAGHRALDARGVRDILVSGLHSDPRGVQISGAYLRGPLDLDGVRSTIGLRFTGCRFDQPPTLRDAVLPWLDLDGCVLPGLAASRARLGTLRIAGCRIEGNSQDGAVRLDSAHILYELNMRETTITNHSGAALDGAALNVGDGACMGVLLDGLSAAGRAGRVGTVRLTAARIGGHLLMRGTWLTNASGPALVADGIRVSGDTRLARSPVSGTEFQATGAAGTGTVLLRGAALAGQLALHGARVKSVASTGPGPPGAADGASPAALNLTGSTIRRDLVLRDTALVNSTGPVLAADRVRVGGSVLADRGFLGHGERNDAAVRLAGAEIGGDLLLNGARLASGGGPALLADGLTVHGDLMLAPGAAPGLPFTAAGTGETGTILLRRATVGGALSLEAAVIHHGGPPGGPAAASPGSLAGPGADGPGERVRAAGEQVRQAVTAGQLVPLGEVTGVLPGTQLAADPEPAGPPSQGAVCLDGGTVGGSLLLGRALLRNDTGPALRAGQLVVRSGLTGWAPPGQGLIALGTGPHGALCLAGADVTGQLALPGAILVNPAGPALAADAARVHGDLLLDRDVVAAGSGPAGAVSLAGAVVGQALSCSGWFSCQPASGPPGPAAGRGPALDLSRASVGTLRLGGRRPAGFVANGGFRLDGLSYSGLPELGDPALLAPPPVPSGRPPRWRGWPWRAGDPGPHQAAVSQWLSWLRHETAQHADQPYAALAAAYQATGRSDLARTILIAQRDDAGARGGLGPRHRLGQHAARWLTGYGYRCWYALVWLAGLAALTVGLAVFWFGPARYIQPTAARAAVPAARTVPAARPAPTARLATTGRAASPAPAASGSPPPSPAPTVTASPSPSPVASPSPAASPSPVPAASRAARAQPARGAGPAECGVAGRAGYALGVVLPLIGPGAGSAGTCAVPATGGTGVLAFGWLVRGLAVTLLVIYALGLIAAARRPAGPS